MKSLIHTLIQVEFSQTAPIGSGSMRNTHVCQLWITWENPPMARIQSAYFTIGFEKFSSVAKELEIL